MNGTFEFIDAADMTVMNMTEHFMATDVEWDPTGRYVVTGVSWWSHKVGVQFIYRNTKRPLHILFISIINNWTVTKAFCATYF